METQEIKFKEMSASWNSPNKLSRLSLEEYGPIKWVEDNTAILIIHGIGNQLPLETLDEFGRGLIQEYKIPFKADLFLTHQIASKRSSSAVPWFDNAVRINLTGSDKYIDIYEYYWANYTEDKARIGDIEDWLKKVVSGANHFYHESLKMATTHGDKSSIVNSKSSYNRVAYWFYLRFGPKLLIPIQFLWALLIKFVGLIPGLGSAASKWLNDFLEKSIKTFNNVIGDIVVYNAIDPKSKFYQVRRQILDGAVNAIKYLIERAKENKTPFYPKVLVAGHSLGSQVAYDAINKLDLLVNVKQVEGYETDGIHTETKKKISEQLCGFITFGSPLDKIAFFLREKVKDKMYLRQQLLDNYHGFKQRNWSFNSKNENGFTQLPQPIQRFFDEVKWRNYFDEHDHVSGPLDYYLGLENVDCEFKAGWLAFTHSRYWDHSPFYRDIIQHFLM